MALPTYYEIAAAVGVPRCRGIRDGFRCYENHETGVIRGGFIHWRDRRVLREGIYHFLKLAAIFIVTRGPDTETEAMPDWAVRYRVLSLIPTLAKEIHIALPRKLSANDRAELAVMLLRVPPSEPGREAALKWARR